MPQILLTLSQFSAAPNDREIVRNPSEVFFDFQGRENIGFSPHPISFAHADMNLTRHRRNVFTFTPITA